MDLTLYDRDGRLLGPMCLHCGGSGIAAPIPRPPSWVKIPGDTTSGRMREMARLRSVLWATLAARLHPR